MPVAPARKPNIQPVEPRPHANEAPETPPRTRRLAPHWLLPILFLVASAFVFGTQATISFDQSWNAPMIVGAGLLTLGALALVAPAIRPLPVAFPAPTHVVPILALAAATFAVTYIGLPVEFLAVAFAATVLVANLGAPTSGTRPFVVASALLIPYAAQATWQGVSFLPFGIVAVTAAVTSIGATRARRHETRVAMEIDEFSLAREKLAAEGVATRETNEAAMAVLEMANALASATEPSDIAERITRRTTKELRAVGTLLLLWDEAIETFRVGAITGRDAPGGSDLRQFEVRPDGIPTLRPNPAGEVVEFAPSVVSEQMLSSILRRWKASKILGVRLQRGDQLLGLLFTARSETQATFLPRDFQVLTGIAVHAAAALDHAGLIADLQSANQLKEEFMATMSHELRTPLNVIIGYTDLQLEGAFGDLTEDHLSTLGTVREQALQLLELIQATLDMSRLERGLVTVDLRDIVIPQFIDQLRPQIPQAWRKPTVDLRWRIEPSLPPLRTDPSKLHIMLRNLIHNALKFTHQGVVTVSVSAQPGKKRVTFVVQDSGVGIKAEHLSGIFEMFRQAPTGDSVPGGVGLGLYIVKRLAAVLGAEIEVSSAPGRGATFRIHLSVAGPLAARS